MIYCSFIISIIASIVLFVFFKNRTTWWEYAIVFFAPVLFVFLMKSLIEFAEVSDKEYWTGAVTRAEYYEEWTEEYLTTEVTVDSDGNTTVTSEEVQDYHYPKYYAYDSTGTKITIDLNQYNYIARTFGNNTEHKLFHPNQINLYKGDGDLWTTSWNNNEETRLVSTTIHNYENRTQSSKKFYFPKVTKEDKIKYGLYDYPTGNFYNIPSILGDGGSTFVEGNRFLCEQNSKLGNIKQVRMWILLFKNKPKESATYQRNYWKGGNKNEFILCIGIDDHYKIEWTDVISWCEQKDLKENVKEDILYSKNLNLVSVSKKLSEQVNLYWKRKNFSDFSELEIDYPSWAVILTFVLTVIVDSGLVFWVYTNEFDSEN